MTEYRFVQSLIHNRCSFYEINTKLSGQNFTGNRGISEKIKDFCFSIPSIFIKVPRTACDSRSIIPIAKNQRQVDSRHHHEFLLFRYGIFQQMAVCDVSDDDAYYKYRLGPARTALAGGTAAKRCWDD